MEKWLAQAELSLETAQLVLPTDPNAACSRAYYAMFYAARAALLTVGGTDATAAKTHSGLIAAFGERLVKPGHLDAALGRALARASHDRLLSDYDGDPIDAALAERTVEAAAAFTRTVVAWIARTNSEAI